MFNIKNDNTNKNYGFSSYDKERLEEMINKYDKDMLVTIADLYGAVNGEKLNLEGITKAVDALTKYNSKSEFNYLNNLLMPEKCKGVKIPSPIPVPSCSFQLHNCVTLSPNMNGNLGVMFNPFFLSSNRWVNTNASNAGDIETYYDVNGNQISSDSTVVLGSGEIAYAPTMTSSLMVCNSSNLTGTTYCSDWKAVNINQTIPDVYDQYRLVSASVVVKYIGRLDIVSGVIGGAIIFDENPFLNSKLFRRVGDGTTAFNALNPVVTETNGEYLGKYGNFDLAMDSFYHQENLVLEGIRQLYFPLDNSYEEYAKLLNQNNVEQIYFQNNKFQIELNTDNYKSGFNFFIYTLGAPNTACLKLDIYCNFECLPNAAFLNYMPVSVSSYSISNQDKKEALSIVQEKPIMKSNETIEINTPTSMGWKDYMLGMAKKFKNTLPGVSKLIGMGLSYFVPKLKPAIALVGSMINSMNQQTPQSNTEMNIEPK